MYVYISFRQAAMEAAFDWASLDVAELEADVETAPAASGICSADAADDHADDDASEVILGVKPLSLCSPFLPTVLILSGG